ncbi:uncharacterized protein LOC127870499 [Dreissena polymorpha]|uniref:uncharacterized protein LOC127870499 n=1 Tax=Dreissena polymorpha TaxID=45954 RepID=UPI002263FBE6|nr:uncharacterized protein LOC127870499 [Dreissena polymorpha]
MLLDRLQKGIAKMTIRRKVLSALRTNRVGAANRECCFFILMLWLIAFPELVGSVRLTPTTKLIDGFDVTLNCAVNNIFHFSFTSLLDDTIRIGGCASFNICFLYEETLVRKFHISKTENGGILTIYKLSSDECGTYTCYDSVDISQMDNFTVSLPVVLATNAGLVAAGNQYFIKMLVYFIVFVVISV